MYNGSLGESVQTGGGGGGEEGQIKNCRSFSSGKVGVAVLLWVSQGKGGEGQSKDCGYNTQRENV